MYTIDVVSRFQAQGSSDAFVFKDSKKPVSESCLQPFMVNKKTQNQLKMVLSC